MSDQRDELLTRVATDVGRIASALEAIVYRLAVRDGAPRVVCERPPGGGDPLAPVNLATGPDSSLTAHPQHPLEVRVRFSPGPHAGGTVAVIPLAPAGTMASRPGWLPHDAYDAPEAAVGE